MIFIFSIGDRKHVDFGPLPEMHCKFCGESHFHIVSKVKYWITLFFLPFFPYKSTWVIRCNHCSGETPIADHEREDQVKRAMAFKEAIDKDWNEVELKEALNRISSHE